MKLPNTEIDDLDLYQDFFDKLQEKGLSFKGFLINVMKDFIDDKYTKTLSNKYHHPADALITEFAIRYIESSLSSITHVITNNNSSLYGIISGLCIDLLEVIDTPKSKHIINNFDQEAALEYIVQKIYN